MTTIAYRGDFFSVSGYGRAVRNHVRALLEQGFDVRIENSSHDNLRFQPDLYWSENLDKVLEPLGGKPDVRIIQETPDFYKFEDGVKTIGFTVWESSKLPDFKINGRDNRWAKILNQCDQVWTASQFCSNLFRESGVNPDLIRVHPHPIDLSSYAPDDKKEMDLFSEDLKDKLVFYTISTWNKRKNVDSLIAAWVAEMGKVKDAVLVVKAYSGEFIRTPPLIQQEIKKIREAYRSEDATANIFFIPHQLSEDQITSLHKFGDVFCSATCGEGFGLPFQEALAVGNPCLYPNASSLSELCIGYGIKTDPEPVFGMNHIGAYSLEQHWWRPRIIDIMKGFRLFYNQWKELGADGFRKYNEEQARACVKDHSFEKVGQDMAQNIREVLG